jgi:RimJ/RimL family protein N-acetyltransferase
MTAAHMGGAQQVRRNIMTTTRQKPPARGRIAGCHRAGRRRDRRRRTEPGRTRQPPSGRVQLAIRESDGGPLAGDTYVDRTLATPWSVEVGITLVPGLHGRRGIATATIAAVLDAVFAMPPEPVHRVVAGLDIDNVRSKALFERLGFQLEAHHVRSGRRRDGSFADELIFAMTAKRWLARPGAR